MSSSERLARGSRSVLLRSQMRVGGLTIVEGASPLDLATAAPGDVQVRSPRFWPMLLHGSRGMAEAYVEGCGSRRT